MTPARQDLPRGQALRRAVNLVNGTTAAGLLVARIGRVRVRRGPGGLLLAGGWRLALPHAAAFTVGNVVLYRSRVSPAFDAVPASALLRHEARHSSQYAVLGLAFLPLYFAAAGYSRLRTGDPASSNIFEVLAGLADGGYRPRPSLLAPPSLPSPSPAERPVTALFGAEKSRKWPLEG